MNGELPQIIVIDNSSSILVRDVSAEKIVAVETGCDEICAMEARRLPNVCVLQTAIR